MRLLGALDIRSHPGTTFVSSTKLLITYMDVCVMSTWSWYIEGYGVAQYNPVTNTLNTPVTVYKTGNGYQPIGAVWGNLGSPIFGNDGYLYLNSGYCASNGTYGCNPGTGGVYLARVPANPSSWNSRSAYTFYTGTNSSGVAQWGSASQAVNSVPGSNPDGGNWQADNYAVNSSTGQQLAGIEITGIAGEYRLWHAPTPAGSWTAGGTGTLSPCSNLCHGLIGHPELSTAAGMMISFNSGNDYHIELSQIPW